MKNHCKLPLDDDAGEFDDFYDFSDDNFSDDKNENEEETSTGLVVDNPEKRY